MATNPAQMQNLVTLIKRLEAATSRLEDIVVYESQTLETVPGSAVSKAESIAPTDGSVTPATTTPPAQTGPISAPLPESITEFDNILVKDLVGRYVGLSAEIGDLVAEQAKGVERCFKAQRLFLLIATKAKKPDISSKAFLDLITDMQTQMSSVNELREMTDRTSPFFDHLSTVSEATPALAWVTLDTKPADFIVEMAGAGQFFGDRVIKSHRETDKKHVDWVRSFYAIFKALEVYVKKYHIHGIVWNKDGEDALTVLSELKRGDSSSGSATTATTRANTSGGSSGGPPPPPPPPPGPAPPAFVPETKVSPPAAGGDRSGIFAEINQGSNVTAGLKKVDKSQMTHKNPALRASSMVSEQGRSKSPGPGAKPKPAHMKQKKPPRMELEGNKWIIENYEDKSDLTIPSAELSINHSIFMFRCKNTTLQLSGSKFNAISMNECEKTNVVLESLVSSIDVIKSKSFAFQILGVVPTIQVDQCDGGTLYVSKASLGIEVFTSKSTAFNVYMPGKTEEDDYVESPIPEQFKTTIKDGKLVSEIVEHMG